MTPAPSDKPRLGSKHRVLLAMERFSRGHYKVVFLIAAVVVVLGAWLGSRLELDSDILALIPEGNRRVDAFKSAVSEFGSVSYLIVLLDAGDEEGPDELEDFADSLAEKFGAMDDLIESTEYRLDPGADFLDLFYDNALLYLPPPPLRGSRACA